MEYNFLCKKRVGDDTFIIGIIKFKFKKARPFKDMPPLFILKLKHISQILQIQKIKRLVIEYKKTTQYI